MRALFVEPSGKSGVLFPLTPALSLGERGNLGQSLEVSWRVRCAGALATILPLPKGEGRGEGERIIRYSPCRYVATRLPLPLPL